MYPRYGKRACAGAFFDPFWCFITWFCPQKCNGNDDCRDNSDEENCESKTCETGYFRCDNGRECIPERWKCDFYQNCADGSDESEETCADSYRECDSDVEFRCDNQKCVSLRDVCDTIDDCGDNSDETKTDCGDLQCHSDQFQCTTSGHCIPLYKRCHDGTADCPDKSDEEHCGTSGLSLDCHRSYRFEFLEIIHFEGRLNSFPNRYIILHQYFIIVLSGENAFNKKITRCHGLPFIEIFYLNFSNTYDRCSSLSKTLRLNFTIGTENVKSFHFCFQGRDTLMEVTVWITSSNVTTKCV